ncbi:MAG TPA: hypothetical protein PLJ39_00890 [Spirochaetota bacterium]|nr:hypothetical protein [Spirochaetota bacterium]HPW51817.1 hypothetical protein [Spirochaetota bacterium]
MASSKPIISQINWLSLIPQIIVFCLILSIFHLLRADDAFLFSAVTYFCLTFLLKLMIPINHRKGIKYFKSGNYEKAVLEFGKSRQFFTRHRWIDKYRSLFLLSSSRISYLEMAMINAAFCYSQNGEGKKSKELYEETLLMFPDSQIALSALKLYESAQNIKKD